MVTSIHTPGLSAQILTSNQPISEIPDPDPVTVDHADPSIAAYQAARNECVYIRIATGQAFSIKVCVAEPIVTPDQREKLPYTKLVFEVVVDGRLVWKPTCCRPFFKHGARRWEETVTGLKEGKGRNCTLKGFRFAKIQTTDDTPERAKLKRVAERMKDVGSIVIKVYNTNYGHRGADVDTTAKDFIKQNKLVPEKALKGEAKSHGVKLGGSQKTSRGEVWRATKKEGEDYPIAIFRFMYRDKEALHSLQIIPRTPSPPPSHTPSRSPSLEIIDEQSSSAPASSSSIDDLTPAQRRQVAQLLATFGQKNAKTRGEKRKMAKIKQELAEESKLGQRAKKRARSDRKEKIMVEISDEEEGGDEEQETREDNVVAEEEIEAEDGEGEEEEEEQECSFVI